MTKEEGLSLGETAHPLKPHELRPPMLLQQGIERLISLKSLMLIGW